MRLEQAAKADGEQIGEEGLIQVVKSWRMNDLRS
jgi:hypothetical protein